MDTPPRRLETILLFAEEIAARPRAERTHDGTNAALLCAALGVSLLQFFLVPLFLPVNAWTVLALVGLCAITTPMHWGLMHESIHGNLFRDAAANRRAGRVLGNFLCLSWDVMRFGHLLHHSNNRHEFDRPEAVPAGGTRLGAAGPYYLKLLGGHALISAVSSIALALPARLTTKFVPKAEPMHTATLRAFTNKERQARIRGDFCATILLVALAIICWGAHWPVFVATVAARFAMLSLLDNAPHYGTAIDSGTYARNTQLPRWAHWLVMGHNYHGIHHGATGLRWQELGGAFARGGKNFEGGWLPMVVRQFRGPVCLD